MVCVDVGRVDVRARRGNFEEQKLWAAGSPSIAEAISPTTPVQVRMDVATTKFEDESRKPLIIKFRRESIVRSVTR